MLCLLALNGIINLTCHVTVYSNLECEETVNYEGTDKFNVRSFLYAGLHLGCGTLAYGVILPHGTLHESVI